MRGHTERLIPIKRYLPERRHAELGTYHRKLYVQILEMIINLEKILTFESFDKKTTASVTVTRFGCTVGIYDYFGRKLSYKKYASEDDALEELMTQYHEVSSKAQLHSLYQP